MLSVLSCPLAMRIPLTQKQILILMLNWILPVGWILLLFSETAGTATCTNSEGNIIVVDVVGA